MLHFSSSRAEVLKTICRILFVCMGAVYLVGCSDNPKPSITEVEPALKSYLLAEKAKSCNGRVEVDHLSVTSVGDFDKHWGGYPVYATFSVTCYDGGSRMTWSSNDPAEKVMTSLVRKNVAGEYECYLPDMFRNAQEQMKKQMENMLKK